MLNQFVYYKIKMSRYFVLFFNFTVLKQTSSWQEKKLLRAGHLLIIDKYFSITLKTVKPQEI